MSCHAMPDRNSDIDVLHIYFNEDDIDEIIVNLARKEISWSGSLNDELQLILYFRRDLEALLIVFWDTNNLSRNKCQEKYRLSRVSERTNKLLPFTKIAILYTVHSCTNYQIKVMCTITREFNVYILSSYDIYWDGLTCSSVFWLLFN